MAVLKRGLPDDLSALKYGNVNFLSPTVARGCVQKNAVFDVNLKLLLTHCWKQYREREKVKVFFGNSLKLQEDTAIDL